MKIAEGAEAIIYKTGNVVKKVRQEKSYRLPEIDLPLRTQRAKREARILSFAREKGIPVPGLINYSGTDIEMEFLRGRKLRDCLDLKCAGEIGKIIGLLHKSDIIHGDLTTSNMIVGEKIYFIDFGLSFISSKVEDKAVDLHLLDRAFESMHHDIYPGCMEEAMAGYKKTNHDYALVLKRLAVVEKRGRNKK